MATFGTLVLIILSCLLSIPIALFLLEVVAAITLPRSVTPVALSGKNYPNVAVLIPAHNESHGLIPTIRDVEIQLRAGDRLLVVADNCTDNTATVAINAGAEVVLRNDFAKIGKGYALDWGVRHLSTAPPGIVIIIDADCRLGDGFIEKLRSKCALTGRPVQAFDKIISPPQSEIDHRFAEFTSRVKNWIRPLGLDALGLPCHLLGTGMAIPWDAIRATELASGTIVEDLKLGLDLTAAGTPPLFCPSAVVSSCFPHTAQGTETQRQRWEQGHLGLLVTAAPRLIMSSVASKNWLLLALTLDLAVPPLLLLGLMALTMFAVSGLVAVFDFSLVPLGVSGSCMLAYSAAVFLCWYFFGRDVLPVRAFPSLIPFVAGKLSLYGRLLSRDIVSVWIRTDRRDSD